MIRRANRHDKAPERESGIRTYKALAAAAIAFALAGVAACSPQHPSEADSAADAPAESSVEAAALEGPFAFSADADCSVCHTVEADSQADTGCTASLHSQQACMDCHGPADAVAAAHDGVEYGDRPAKRLKSTGIEEESCLASGCHDGRESLAEKTADSQVLTDSNGTTVNPHAMPESADHATLDCGNCHDMHSSKAIEETAPQACIGCHHTGVYECHTCHD